MITMKSNIQVVIGKEISKLKEFLDPLGQQNLLRTIAVSMLPVVHDRIHVQGLDANGSPIGTYSPGYLKRRNKLGRGSDPKVILTLTRDMETDFASGLIATEKGYGLGFKKVTNYEKSQYVEATYNKKIYGLTPSEKDTVLEIAKEEVQRALSS